MKKKLNIKICTTDAKNPFSNGTVEHYNLIVVEAMEKMLEDEKCGAKMHFQIILEKAQMSLCLGSV